MKKVIFAFLFFTTSFLSGFSVAASSVISEVRSKTHLRWNLYADREKVSIDKKGNKVLIKTLQPEIYQTIVNSIPPITKKSKRYIKEVKKIGLGKDNVSTIEIQLANSTVELFNFYRDSERKYVLDFWVDKDSVSLQKSSVKKKKEKSIKRQTPKIPKLLPAKKITRKSPSRIRKPHDDKETRKYRDFRYGASFIWNYPGLSPQLKKLVRIDRKTPEYFYPVKNADFEKSDQQAHLQLNINLYRKKSYGLMYKSINLYHQKYGEETDSDLNEYLKANAILRDNFEKGNREPLKMAINMLKTIQDKTQNYDLKKAIMKYLIAFYQEKSEHYLSLQTAKLFYVESKENFDFEESAYAAEVILHNLANLEQVHKINEVLKDKTIIKIVPKQIQSAYKIFTLLKMGKTDEVLRYYSKIKKSLVNPIHPTIIYNVAESMFRSARYPEAVKLYDKLIKEYSYISESSRARLRIALIYDLMNKPIKQVLSLYKNAINRSQDPLVSFEARIRYVGVRAIRKIKLTPEDIESRVFLERDQRKQLVIHDDMKKLLWLVRLRSFIVDHKWTEALSYLKVLPLKTMKPTEQRVFQSDGAEIIYGIIHETFLNGDYTNVARIWESYKTKFISKVALNPYLNYIVAKSYLNLNLNKSFETIFNKFKSMKRGPVKTFPFWVDYKRKRSKDVLIYELEYLSLMKNEKHKEAKLVLEKMKKNKGYWKVNLYEGMISFKQNNYSKAVGFIEKFLVSEDENKLTDPVEIADMMNAYALSLYEMNKLDKFKVVAESFIADTQNFAKKNRYLQSVREEIDYLNIEVMSGENSLESNLLLESKIIAFKKEFKDSVHLHRVNYINGLTLIRNKKIDKGTKVFNEILNDKDVSEHIKELTRSELSLQKIRSKTI